MKKITRDISPAKVNSQIEKGIEREMDNENSAMLATSSPRFFSDDEEGNDHLLTLNLGPVGTRRDSLTATKRRRSLDFTTALGENQQHTHATASNNDNKNNFLASLPPIDSPTLLKKEQKKKQLATAAETEPIPLHSLHLADSFMKYLHRKGIKKLYDWQSDVLNTPGVLTHGQNIVYCAPTSGGKSLVADILLARRLTQYKGCICLLVLPFVSLCVERAKDLEIMLSSVHRLRVLRHFGGSGGGIPKSGTGQTYLIVCTPEKANALVTKMIEQSRLKDLKCVVVDELHMVQEAGRGATLECLLTKLVYATEENGSGAPGDAANTNTVLGDVSQYSSSDGGYSIFSPPSKEGENVLNNQRPIQIVGMSATLPNVHALAEWLDASCSISNYRPVTLEVFVKSRNDVIDSVSGEVVRTLDAGNDVAHVGQLCMETLQENGQVLVFCGTRDKCRILAEQLAKLKFMDVNLGIGNSIEAREQFAHDALPRNEKDGSMSDIAKYITAGIAFHHAGMQVEERQAIEVAYKRGLVRIVCATSTLAAGVNMPARRVIVRDLLVGGTQKLAPRNLQQMIGRAGRAGLDDRGSAYVFVSQDVPDKLLEKKIKEVRDMLEGDLPELESALAQAGMRRVMLEGCASGLVRHAREVKRYAQKTLLSALNDFDDYVQSIAVEALKWLQDEALLKWCPKTHTYSASNLGNAAAQSGMVKVESIRRVEQDLLLARKALVLATPLHLLFLITPTLDWREEEIVQKNGKVIKKMVPPNPLPPLDQKFFVDLYSNLCPLQMSVLEMVGIDRAYVETRLQQGRMDNPRDENHARQRLLCVRFINALILLDLVEEVKVDHICKKYSITGQYLKKLQEESVRLGFTVSSVCMYMRWQDLGDLVNRAAERLMVGGREDILPLTCVGDCIDVTRARALLDAGMKSPKDIVGFGVKRVQKAIKRLNTVKNSAYTANQIFRMCEKFIAEEAKAAREEAEQRMRELMEEEELFCLEEENNTANDTTNTVLLKEEEDMWAGGCRRGAKKRKDHDFVDKRDSAKNNNISNKHAKRDQTTFTSEDEEAFALDQDPGIIFCRDVEQVAALTKKWRESEKYAILFEPNPLEPFSLPPIGIFLAFSDECVYFMRLRAKPRGEAGNEATEIVCETKDKPACSIATAIEILRDGRSKKMTIDLKPQLRSLLSAETFEDRESRLKNSARLADLQPYEHFFAFCGENVFDLRIMAWLLRSDVQTTPCVSSANAWGSSRMLRSSAESNSSKVILNSSSTSLTYETSLCDAILRTFIGDLSPTLNVSKIERQAAYDPRAKINKHQKKLSTIRTELAKAVATVWHISETFENLCKKSDVYEVLKTLEMPFARALADIENIGMPINATALGPHIAKAQKRRDEIETICKQWYSPNIPLVNLNSSTDVSVLLFEILALTPPDGAIIPYSNIKNYNGKGRNDTLKRRQRFRVDADCLKQLMHPVAALISEHRSLGKYIATAEELSLVASCPIYEEEGDNDDATRIETIQNRIYAFSNQTDTETGRKTSVNPNLYSIPNGVVCDERVPTSLRSLFEAPPGRILVACDYAQLELRLIAHYSEDATLISSLSSNPFEEEQADPFTRIASKWMRVKYNMVTDEQRRQTKNLVYSVIYGSGSNSFARKINVSENEATRMLDELKSTTFLGIEKWKSQIVALEKTKDAPRAITLSGRFRDLPELKSENISHATTAERVFINTLMQGSAADILKKATMSALENLRKKSLLKKTDLILTVHDELMFECDENLAKMVGRETKKAMEDIGKHFNLKVPLFADLRIGKTWADLSKRK